MGHELIPVTWRTPDAIDAELDALQPVPTTVLRPAARGVKLPSFTDERGTLVPVDVPSVLPFPVQRTWSITGAPSDTVRGRHAHYECHQAFWLVSGSARFTFSDGDCVSHQLLRGPDELAIVPAGLWVQIDQFAEGTVIIAFASHAYDPHDYRTDITRDYLWKDRD